MLYKEALELRLCCRDMLCKGEGSKKWKLEREGRGCGKVALTKGGESAIMDVVFKKEETQDTMDGDSSSPEPNFNFVMNSISVS